MGYLIELDDLRSRIKYPPEVPPPMETWSEPDAVPETEVVAISGPEQTAWTGQQELELIFNEPER